MPKTQKCAHQACSCLVAVGGEFGDYCSQHCKEAGDIAELRCECGHDACTHEQARPPHG